MLAAPMDPAQGAIAWPDTHGFLVTDGFQWHLYQRLKCVMAALLARANLDPHNPHNLHRSRQGLQGRRAKHSVQGVASARSVERVQQVSPSICLLRGSCSSISSAHRSDTALHVALSRHGPDI